MQTALIEALQKSGSFEVIETHISWVILTGPFAYKIKKAVNLGFQDFTTLEKRKLYCEKEVILNRRLAPSVYIEVVPITGTMESPSINGKGLPIEFAVKMHQFSQEGILEQLATQNQITLPIINDLAHELANFHQSAEKCPSDLPFGTPESVYAPINENFKALRAMPALMPFLTLIKEIEEWSLTEYKKHQDIYKERKRDGFIRACHGDLHLGNMVLINDKPVIFDCIEFNESFRWIDVMNDIGFLTMDFDHYSLPSSYLLNKYLECTLDYDGVRVLRLYQSYRAMVRAKIMAIQKKKTFKEFISLAKRYTQVSPPSLTISFGLSGSGKTYETELLMMKTNAIRLRSDIFRQHIECSIDEKYSLETTRQVYTKLLNTTEMLLKENYSVIVDATFLKKWQRELFFELRSRMQIPFRILVCEASLDVLYKRLEARQGESNVSDATAEVLNWQVKEVEPLTDEEKLHTQ